MKKKTVAISVVSVAVVVAIVIALLLNGKKAVPASTQGKSAYDIISQKMVRRYMTIIQKPQPKIKGINSVQV